MYFIAGPTRLFQLVFGMQRWTTHGELIISELVR